MRRRRLAAALVLAATLPTFGAGPATATTAERDARISNLELTNDVLTFLLRADGLAEGEVVDPASVTVTVDGTSLSPPDVKQVPSAVARTVVLAIDNSRSMSGDKLDSAKDAARTFVELLPDDVTAGLVTFAGDAVVVVPNNSDRESLLAAIDDISLNDVKGTALYDAVALAADVTGAGGSRGVLLLTDGEEDGSSALSLEDAAEHATDDGVTVDAVLIGESDATIPENLQDLVALADGQVGSSAAGDLSDVLAKVAAAIEDSLFVTVALPGGVVQAGDVLVTARANGFTLEDRGFLRQTTGPDDGSIDQSYGPQPVERASWAALRSASVLPFVLGVLFAGLLLVLYVALSAFRRDEEHGRLGRRLSSYTMAGRPAAAAQGSTALGSSQVARSAVELAGRMVARRDFEARLTQRLDSAGVPLRAAEWTLIHAGIAIGAALLLLLLSGGRLLPTVLGLILGLGLPVAYLAVKESRRTSAFLSQLPDTLQLVAGSLSAGYSVPQALDTVVREGTQPITGEFNRALVEARLGVPIEEALDGVAERMQSKDFAWVVMAIRIQRDVGGNLAELLTTVSGTLRERDRLRRQVNVLSAEGRLSAWILGLLPLVFATYLLLVQPQYLAPLVTNALGWLLLGLGVSLLVVGAIWMRKVVRVEV